MENDVKSNKEFVDEYTNTILNDMDMSQIEDIAGNFVSTTKCPSAEPEVVNLLISGCNKLVKIIKDDIENIKQIGDDIEKMDNIMREYATTLDLDV